MISAANDNQAPGRSVRIIGSVRDDGRVTITDLTWRPEPRQGLQLVEGDGKPQP